MAAQAIVKPTTQGTAADPATAKRAGAREGEVKQAYTSEPTAPGSPAATTTSGTIIPAQTTHIEAKARVQDAERKLTVATAVIASVVMIAAILVLLSTNTSGDGTKSGTELTYREPSTARAESTTIAPTPKTTTRKTTEYVPPTEIRKDLDARALLCTYGDATNTSTVFPPDGLCDLIFFDSAYKGYKNIPSEPDSFYADMKAFLSAAQRYQSTEFGVAFAYKYHTYVRKELKNNNSNLLDVFWSSGIIHFGIVDVPAFGISQPNITDVLTMLKEISVAAMERPDTLRQPYTVFGAVTGAIAQSYASEMRDVYTPTLFISQGHYAFGDNEVPDCKRVPPTMLQKPAASQGYTYDLTEALSALQLSQDAGASAKWLVSVTMKGRLTVSKTNSTELLSDCKSDANAKSFGTYVEVCTNTFLRKKMKYSDKLEAAHTFNVFKKLVFVYDNEKSLCNKMCRLKSKNDNLPFGIAVYDLEYEDYNNNCTDLNVFGEFSRLKMVRKLVDYFRTSSASGARCENDVPCPKGADA